MAAALESLKRVAGGVGPPLPLLAVLAEVNI